MTLQIQKEFTSDEIWVGEIGSESGKIEISIDAPNGKIEAERIKQDILSNQLLVKKLHETIDFLKVESIGGIWNTPQLINMLEDLFRVKK